VGSLGRLQTVKATNVCLVNAPRRHVKAGY
ncbi:MAG: hypothetical protein ACJARG_001943, partial [Arcticibacterium sp.]